jgi:methyl-accepting chemotaxis protein
MMQTYFAQLEQLLVPLLIAAVIFVFSITVFVIWSRRIDQIRKSVTDLDNWVRSSNDKGRDILAQAQSKTPDEVLRFLLRETEAGLIDLPAAGGTAQTSTTSYSFRSHAETWTVRDALGGRLNLSLFETMPNLLIGFGLMCTFIFLAVALQQAGLALNALDVSARQQDQALQSLIATAGGKFITSIAGLLCSLVWNWRAKISLGNLQSSIDALCHTLRRKIPDNAAEASMRVQLSLFQEILQQNQAQVAELKRLEGGLTNAGSQAAGELSKAGAVLTQGITTGMASFGDAVQALAQTIQTTNSTVHTLDTALSRAATAGQQGAQQLESLMAQLSQILVNLQTVMGGLQSTADKVDATADKFQTSATAIENAVTTQQETANTFKDSARTTEQALETVRTHLMDAQKALNGTVDALTKGVSAYSTQVAGLHTKMDQHLATAVNQLGGSITNLEEVLDEFIDALPPKS